MNITRVIRFLLNKFTSKKRVENFDINVFEKRILSIDSSSFNCIERSYYQYRAQSDGIVKSILFNVVAFPLFYLYILFLLLSHLINPVRSRDKVDYVLVFKQFYSKLPKSIAEADHTIAIAEEGSTILLSALLFCLKIVASYPFSYYFHLNNLRKIAGYCYFIKCYSPDIILACSEGSWSSSVLTQYCNQLGIKHVNFMHGEKLLSVNDCFAYFNTFYVWDEHYLQLFRKTNCKADEFVIENTILDIWKNTKKVNEINNKLVYYLQLESLEELANIKVVLQKLSKEYDVYIRPHPRDYSKLWREALSDYKIDKMDIDASVHSAKYIVSKYSTVLYEGYVLDKIVVIDDISNSILYKKLQESEYILTKKNIKKLSDFIGE